MESDVTEHYIIRLLTGHELVQHPQLLQVMLAILPNYTMKLEAHMIQSLASFPGSPVSTSFYP